jgi:hypothetical protein
VRRTRYDNAMPKVSYNQRSPKTPSQRFASLLAEAEKRFGPRSRELQFTLAPRTNPVPETMENGPDGCVVYYFDQVASDPERLCFQLAHESIHVLSGGLRRSARNIEEGLAVWFSLNNSQLLDRNYKARARVSLPALYKKALDLFCGLNPSDDSIKVLRAEASNLDDVTPDLLVKLFSASPALAENLCERVSEEMQDRLK